MNIQRQMPGRQSGISYIEVLIATLLVLITLLPMMDAMRGATQSAAAHEQSAMRHELLRARMEEVLAEPWSSLASAATAAANGGQSFDQPSRYSDLAGTADRRVVYLSFSDGDNADGDDDVFTGVETNLMWVRVEIEGTQLAVESLAYQ